MKTSFCKVLIGGLAAIYIFLFTSCASLPHFDPDLPPVEIEPASDSDIKKFGIKPGENPYLEPISIIKKKLNEFYILKIRFNLSERTYISIHTESLKEDGSEAGRFYTAEQFLAFWEQREFYTEDNNPYGNSKIITIQRSCIPSLEFFQNPGISEYFLPLESKYPIPRPANIYIQISLGSREPIIFKYTLE